MAGVVSPLGVPSTTKFDALPPGSNNEAVLLPDTNGSGTNTILAVNARTYQPALIDAQGNVTIMKPNTNYSMTGSEKFVYFASLDDRKSSDNIEGKTDPSFLF